MEFFLIYYAVQASLAPNLKVPYLLLPQEAKTNFFPEKISLSFQSLSSRRNVISARNGGQTREEASQVGKQMRKEEEDIFWLHIQNCSHLKCRSTATNMDSGVLIKNFNQERGVIMFVWGMGLTDQNIGDELESGRHKG